MIAHNIRLLAVFLGIGLLSVTRPAGAQEFIGTMSGAACLAAGGVPDSAITSREDPDPARPCRRTTPRSYTSGPIFRRPRSGVLRARAAEPRRSRERRRDWAWRPTSWERPTALRERRRISPRVPAALRRRPIPARPPRPRKKYSDRSKRRPRRRSIPNAIGSNPNWTVRTRSWRQPTRLGESGL